LKYPPAAVTSNNGGFAPFTQFLSAEYGSGDYRFSLSSYHESNVHTAGKFFDGVGGSDFGGGVARNTFSAPAGTAARSSSFIVPGYIGEWIKVQMPVAIYLAYFKMYMRGTGSHRAASDYRVYGSNDDSAWDLLIDTVGATYAEDPSIAGANFHKSDEVSPAYKYQYYAIVVSKLTGGSNANTLNLEEIEIHGNEEKLCGMLDTSAASKCLAGQEYFDCDWPSTVRKCKQVCGAHDPPPPPRGAVQCIPWVGKRVAGMGLRPEAGAH
jgi:hypothetical protein